MTQPLPIPDGVAEVMGGTRVTIGDPQNDEVASCQYVLTRSKLYPGRPCFTALVGLSEEERAAIAGGANLSLTLDGGEFPWSLAVEPPA